MERKPFNLKEALAGTRVTTRNGQEVTGLHFFAGCVSDYPLVGLVEGELNTFTIDGRVSQFGESDFDLFLGVEHKEAWVNVYRNGDGSHRLGLELYPTEGEARAGQNPNAGFVYTARVQWEE